MQSRVWAEYGSLTMRGRPVDAVLPEVDKGGGRGYYRNISLLSAWAHAPFMHNNAIGPEICGKPKDPQLDFYASPYVDANGKPLTAGAPDCWTYDPSVAGRFKLYEASMDELLNPDKRVPKMFVLDKDIVIDIAPKVTLLDRDLGLQLKIPAGFPAVDVNSLRYKDLIEDLVLVGRDADTFDARYRTRLTPEQRAELKAGLTKIRAALLGDVPISVIQLAAGREDEVVERVQGRVLEVNDDFIQRFYSNVLGRIENAGHRFGEGLSEREKKALIAFVATL